MTGLRVLVGIAVGLMAPLSFGATDQGQTVQAKMLDHNEFPCSNCLFGVSDYYFCFDASSRILIGHDKVRTQTWQHTPTALMERGKTVPIRFDDKYIWVPQATANGKMKDLRLTQDYTKKIFLNSERCQSAVKE
jgi:hypothetical protein